MSAFDWFQKKVTRRTAIKGAAAGTAVGTAALIGADMHLAVQDAAAANYRPLVAEEWEYFFTNKNRPISRLQEPPPGTHGDMLEWYLGEDAHLIENEDDRAMHLAFELRYLEAYDARDQGWFEEYGGVVAPTESHLPEASAHFCIYNAGSPKYEYNCHLHFKENRSASSCSQGISCWGWFHCHNDFHSSYCKLHCGICTPF